MTSQVVKVRSENLSAWMTCPLCFKLLREATTISLCLHTFCRKCIYEKLSDEEVDSCPVCNIDLGCVPVEKLRPDHNLQDIRAKIFPFKRRKVKTPELTPSVSLPIKRKERSLSSLVVSTPKVSIQTGLTGRRTKSVPRKSAPNRGSSISVEEPIKKEVTTEDCPESSSAPHTLNKIVQDKRQISSPTKSFHNQIPNKVKENDAEAWEGNVDLWKPLNCLVEAANRTKSSKLGSQDSSPTKSEPLNALENDVHVPKTKVKEHQHKSKVQEDKNGTLSLPVPVKRRRLRVVDKKNAAGRLCASAQAMLEIPGAKQHRRKCPIWFSLVASEDQVGDVPLPQISACYLRIKNGNLPVSFIQKYLVKKLDLTSEAEIYHAVSRSILPSCKKRIYSGHEGQIEKCQGMLSSHGGDNVPGSTGASNSAITELGRFVVKDSISIKENTDLCRQLSQGLCDGPVLFAKGPTRIK